MMDLLEGLLGLAALLAVLFAIYLPLNWVLGPLDRAAKNRQYPIQFSLADFLCFFVEVQLVLAWPALAFRETDNKTAMAGITVLVVALVFLVWWTGVRTLSRAGVHGTFSRAFTLTVCIPFGYAFSIAIPVLPIAIFTSLTDGPTPNRGLAGLLSAIELAIIPIVVVLGFATRSLLAAAKRKQEPASPEKPAPPK